MSALLMASMKREEEGKKDYKTGSPMRPQSLLLYHGLHVGVLELQERTALAECNALGEPDSLLYEEVQALHILLAQLLWRSPIQLLRPTAHKLCHSDRIALRTTNHESATFGRLATYNDLHTR